MSGEVWSILADLRASGATVKVAGSRLRVEADRAPLTSETKQMLRERKTDFVKALYRERVLLGSSLDEFERRGQMVELRVAWYEQTVWFVPSDRHVQTLLADGVARGRIWTVQELAEIAIIPNLTRDDAARIGLLKATFQANILSAREEGSDG